MDSRSRFLVVAALAVCCARSMRAPMPPLMLPDGETSAQLIARLGCADALGIRNGTDSYEALVWRDGGEHDWQIAFYRRDGDHLRKIGAEHHLLDFDPPHVAFGILGTRERRFGVGFHWTLVGDHVDYVPDEGKLVPVPQSIRER